MLSGQLQISCLRLFDLLLKEKCTEVDDALDLRLIVHVLHEFVASIVGHNRRPLLAPVKFLQIKTMDQVIITKMFNECDVFTSFSRGSSHHYKNVQ